MTLAFLLLALSPSIGDPTTAAPTAVDVQANTFTGSTQDNAALALAPDGGFVVAWHSRRQEDHNYGVYAQRFDARGERIGGEVRVNQHAPLAQTNPCVAIDAQGVVWFAWESYGQDGDRGGIVARRFDTRLETSTSEVIVNDGAAGEQGEVALACDASGRAWVAWTTPGTSEHEREVRARRLAADGQPLGASFHVAGAAGQTLRTPTIALDRDGNAAFAWCRSQAQGLPLAIAARAFDAEGRGQEEQVLADAQAGAPIEPVLAFTHDGEFVAAWLAARADDYVATVARFTLDRETARWTRSNTTALVDELPGYTSALELALDARGDARVLWNRHVEGAADVRVARVERDGTPHAPQSITTTRDGEQRLRIGGGARRAWLRPDGALAVAWHGAGSGGDTSSANLTLAGLALGRTPAIALADIKSPRFAEEAGAAPHEPPILDPSGAIRREDFLLPESGSGPDYGFLGIPQTTLTPPDPHLSVGPNHVVEVVNANMSFFTKGGAQTFTSTFVSFFAPVGGSGFIFDPETLFDPHTNRFLVMANERVSSSSFFLVAYSDDADPNGTWFKYRFNVTSVAGANIDSPNFSLDSQAVYLGADFFSPDRYLVFIVEKAPMLTGGTPITRSFVITGSHSYGMPLMYTAAPTAYMVQALETATASTLRLHGILNPLTTPSDVTFDLTVPTYSVPEDPPQAGSSTRPELFEARFWSATFRNGRLWCTHHQGSTRALQRWYEIDMQNWPTSGTPTLVQTGDVDPGAGIRTFFGSIAVDAQNNMGLVFARSSPSEFISMSRVYRAASDPAGTTQAPVIMRGSTAPTFVNRWGDYSACVPDPTYPRVFWGAHEFQTSNWATWIGMFGPCSPPVPYCTAKLTSLGLLPIISGTNEPSLGANNFQITVQNGMPNGPVLYFHGPVANNVPFGGGTLCVGSPIVRGPVASFSPTGTVSIPFPIAVGDVGKHRFFQAWFRDALQPDGTGLGLTGGLDVEICP